MTTTQTDPLQRIRHELVTAAGRANRQRRKRRIVLLAVLPAILLTASAGAAAIGVFGTGVGSIDRLLATEGGGGDAIDPRSGPHDASAHLRLPNAADGTDAALVAYVSSDGRICKAQADLRRSDNAPRGTSGGPCFTPSGLSQTLSANKALCCASSNGPDRRIYDGFAAGEVIALHFHMEDGASFDAKLTPEWTPEVPGAEPLRLFVAVDERDIDVGADGVQSSEEALLKQRYSVVAELRDGRILSIRTP